MAPETEDLRHSEVQLIQALDELVIRLHDVEHTERDERRTEGIRVGIDLCSGQVLQRAADLDVDLGDGVRRQPLELGPEPVVLLAALERPRGEEECARRVAEERMEHLGQLVHDVAVVEARRRVPRPP